MDVVLAKESDNAKILEFFNKQSFLTGPPVDITINRKNSFFDKYKLQSEDFDTFIMEDRRGEIHGVATLLYRDALIQGTPTLIGYGTDLRVSANRQATLQWPELFFPAFKDSLEKRNCKLTFSVINFSQIQAMNALIRPRAQRRDIPRYYLIRKFDLVSLHGRTPFLQGNPLNTVKIFEGTPNDLEPLVEYLKKKTESHLFAFPYSIEFMENRFKKWKGLSIEKFLIAKDVHGNIVGCCAPWSNAHLQTLDVTKYSDLGESFHLLSRLISIVRMGKALPASGQPLKLSYLTHLNCDNPDIFRRLLKSALKRSPRDEFLVYVNFDRDAATLPPPVFISSTLRFAMYSVLAPETPLPSYLQPSPFSPPPELEAVLI